VLQLANLRAREKIARSKAPKILFDQKLARSFIENLPFELTYDQKKTAWEILQDLQREIPMNRLLQGDVGSGKTVVAAMCALQVIKSGFQVVLMAPTEILAQQHYKTFEKILRPFNVKTTLITSSTSGVNLETSGVELFIGTHALISGKVRFKNLGLVIIDEQHRFGVSQRSLLVNKASCQDRLPAAVSISGLDTAIPHFLSMTATPIPRTLALTVYGDLDISVIKEKPAGRKQIISRLVEESDRAKAIQFVKEQIRQGRQVFVICPRIEGEDEEKSAKAVYKKMTEEDFKEFKVGLLHGRQKTKEKEETMQKFVRGDLDILVSTTVVEVGVDVPNATVMWIEGAEHFGLATLHQLRGRVGRGEYRSYCLLFFSPDLSDISRSRLKAFVLSDNGFELAEKDLELRGPGELWGTRQHGLPELEYASLLDFGLIQKTKKEAELIFPVLDSFPGLKAKVEEFEINVHRE
jgi:ATP-dependent DNA helicase RecG